MQVSWGVFQRLGYFDPLVSVMGEARARRGRSHDEGGGMAEEVNIYRHFMRMSSRFGESGQAFTEVASALLPSLMYLADILPKESIVWKMKMLRTAPSFQVILCYKAQVLSSTMLL